MSDDPIPKRRINAWMIVVGGLTVVVAIMGYGLFEMNAKLDALTGENDDGTRGPVVHIAQSPNMSIDPDAPMMHDVPLDTHSWDPFQEMEAMQRRIDTMFNDAFGRLNTRTGFNDVLQGFTHSPRLDLTDEGDRYVARLDIPGSNDAEINVSIEGQTLTVEGETTQRDAQQNPSGQVLRNERIEGKFRRQVTLPDPVDPSKEIKTEYKDGVYTATVYKLHPDKSDS